MPKEKVPCKCLSIIMLDSVIEAYEKYHLQTFLEECKYVQEKTYFRRGTIIFMIVILMMKQNLIMIMIMMNMMNNLLKVF